MDGCIVPAGSEDLKVQVRVACLPLELIENPLQFTSVLLQHATDLQQYSSGGTKDE
jgi:hypothetical protein